MPSGSAAAARQPQRHIPAVQVLLARHHGGPTPAQRPAAAPPSRRRRLNPIASAARNDWVAPDNSTTPASTGAQHAVATPENQSQQIRSHQSAPGGPDDSIGKNRRLPTCQGRTHTGRHRRARRSNYPRSDATTPTATAQRRQPDRHRSTSPQPAATPASPPRSRSADRTLSRNRPAASPDTQQAPAGRRPRPETPSAASSPTATGPPAPPPLLIGPGGHTRLGSLIS